MKNLVTFLIGVLVFVDCPEMFFAAGQRERELDAQYFGNGHLRAA